MPVDVMAVVGGFDTIDKNFIDLGRFEATKQEADKHFFKVPSLRNITETGPYLHNGSVKTLEEMVNKMAEHQLGKTLTAEENASIVTFLKSLKDQEEESRLRRNLSDRAHLAVLAINGLKDYETHCIAALVEISKL